MTGFDPKAALAQLESRCAQAGVPLTPQRRAVLEILVQRTDHPTVDQLYGAVSERLPDVSRATVYRSLEKLEELGLLRRVDHPGSAVRHDGNTSPHHHFLCTRCGTIEDLPLAAVRGHQALAYEADHGQAVSEISVLVRGLCRACGQRPRA